MAPTVPTPPPASPPGQPRSQAQAPDLTLIVSRSIVWSDALAAEYRGHLAACRARPEWEGRIAAVRRGLRRHRGRYVEVEAATGVPWWWVGITHSLESGQDFGRHLHNGDPLSARTVQVPAGRPRTGTPPFAWDVSAVDALRLKGLVDAPGWGAARALHRWEAWNGFGYRRKGRATPYLWSGSTLYRSGKYVADGRYDPAAVSQQVGAAVLLLALMDDGEPVAP